MLKLTALFSISEGLHFWRKEGQAFSDKR